MTPTLSQDNSHDRKQFFGCLNAMRRRLERYGVSGEDVRSHYAQRFGVERMRFCSQRDWAVAAAEVQAMLRSSEIFANRITGITKGVEYGNADGDTKANQQLGGG